MGIRIDSWPYDKEETIRKFVFGIMLIVLFSAFIFDIPPVMAEDVDDWPMFHGDQQHTGYSDKSVIPPLQPIWSVDVHAPVESASLAVKDDILYIGGSNQLWAINANTGTIIWRSPDIGGRLSTPAIGDDGIYVATWDATYCISKIDGSIQWAFSAKHKNLSHSGFFIDSSPIFNYDRVYIGLNDGYLYAINAITGEEVWEFQTSGPIKCTPAIYNDNIIYFGSGHGGYYHDSNFYAVDLNFGNLIWVKSLSSDTVSSPSIRDGTVYVGSGPYVYAMDALNGRFIWQYKISDRDYIESSPAVTSTTVYICGGDWSTGPPQGSLYAISKSDGRLRWSVGTDFTRASPSVAGDIVYLEGYREEGGLFYAIDANNGNILWTYPTRQSYASIPAIVNNMVYVVIDGAVVAFCPPLPLTIKLSGTAGNHEWYVSNVLVTFLANESGLLEKTEYSLDNVNWYTYPGPFSITNEGMTTIQYRLMDNTLNVRKNTIKIDKTSPTIIINTPVEGKEYILNEQILSDWSAKDTLSGIASASATVPNGEPIDVRSFGEKHFTVEASDNAGNHITRMVTYLVRTNPDRYLLYLKVVDSENRPLDGVAITLWNEEVGFSKSYQKIVTNRSGWAYTYMPEGNIIYVGEWKSTYNLESVCIMSGNVSLHEDKKATEQATVYDNELEVVSSSNYPISGAVIYVSNIRVGITGIDGKVTVVQMPTIYSQKWTGNEWLYNCNFPVKAYWQSMFNPEPVQISSTFIDGTYLRMRISTTIYDKVILQIVSPLGNPIAGAEVNLAGISIGMTSVNGSVMIPQVPSWYTPTHQSYPVTITWFDIDISSNEVTFTSSGSNILTAKHVATLTIQVIGAQGQALKAPYVEIKNSAGTTVFQGLGDEQGVVSVEVPYDTYNIHTDYKGFINDQTTTISSATPTPLKIANNIFIEISGQAMTFATFMLWIIVIVIGILTIIIVISRYRIWRHKTLPHLFGAPKGAKPIYQREVPKEILKPICPKCGFNLERRGEVFWCSNCVGWIAPKDVKWV